MKRQDTALIGMVAETYVHVGVGQSSGALDLPVARERATHWPFVPGSGVKGAMRVWCEEHLGPDVGVLFGARLGAGDSDDGSATQAGALLWSDARLLLLPVRSTSGSYRLVTSMSLLNRLRRDRRRAGLDGTPPDLAECRDGTFLGADGETGWLGLEEREFERAGDLPPDVLQGIEPLVAGTFTEDHLARRITILSDDDFSWFARFALPVMSRNSLDENKIVKGGALWVEETLPPDTVMYALVAERTLLRDHARGGVRKVRQAIADGGDYVQLGGNETIGQGWFRLTVEAPE